MTVHRQLRRSFGVLTTAVLLMVVMFGGTAAYILLRVHPDVREAVLASRWLHTAHESMIDQETGIRGFLLSDPSNAATFLQPYDAGRSSTLDAFHQAGRYLQQHPGDLAKLRRAERAALAWQQEWADAAVAHGHLTGADNRQQFLARGKALFDQYRHAEAVAMDSLTASTNSRLGAEEIALLATLGLVGVGGIIVVGLVAVQRRSLSRRIVQPVMTLAATVRAIRDGTSDGTPSDDALPAGTPKEITALWHDFQEMMSSLELRREAIYRERDEARELSELDTLTGLLNRRRMSRDLKAAIGSGERVLLSLVMVDIDNFKKVNDTLGHQAGDNVLRAVSAVLSKVVRGSDRVYRLGGEEFVILAPGATEANAQDLAERVRAAVAKMTNVTVSCGVACWTQGTNTSVELLARADAALYAAKRAGRNRVLVADEHLVLN